MQKQTLESIVGLVMASNRLTDGNFFRLLLIAEIFAGYEPKQDPGWKD